jgi:hypothetical protein
MNERTLLDIQLYEASDEWFRAVEEDGVRMPDALPTSDWDVTNPPLSAQDHYHST